MPSRSTDPPPRRGGSPRRGAPRSGGDRDHRGDTSDEPDGAGSGFTGISDARAYTPRGRTLREAAEQRRAPRAGRSGDPFRPALQVLDGGKPVAPRDRRRGGDGPPEPPARRDASPARATTARTRPAAAGAEAAGTGLPKTRTATSVPRRPTAGRGGAGRPAVPAGRGTRRPGPPSRPPRLADPRRRLRLGTLVALTLFAVIGVRLVVVQVADPPAYAGSGFEQRLKSVALPAPRGAIYDRSMKVLAQSVEARYVYADPTLVKDVRATAAALSPLLAIPVSKLEPKLKRHKRPDGGESQFEYLARGVDVPVAERIMALDLAGINTARDERRHVPGADLAANIIGFTGEALAGLEGMEARYDDLLRGVDGKKVFETGNPYTRKGEFGKELPGGYKKVTEAQPGTSLQLTLDRDLQFEVQRVLSTNMKKVNATIGAAVVLDVRTGEVLAQASHPAYNAADPLKSGATDREDVATSVVVDPGSVHKALIFGAALEEGIVAPDSTLVVGPAIRKGDTVFADTHPHPAGTRVTLPGLMAYSSNVGTIKLADELTPQKVYDYQQRFGLGRATGEGVPGEASGRLLPPGEWSGSSYGSVPIGHSVDATPIQMAAAYAAIANNGTWVQPHLIRATVAPDGRRTPATAPQTRRVLSPSNAAALRTMLEAVVTVPDATGATAAIPGYRVAGKTGTGARIVDGRYTRGEVASFIGMAPADKPRYVIAVFAHTPGGNGGEVAGPAFRDMMSFVLRHYRVPPTGADPPKFTITR